MTTDDLSRLSAADIKAMAAEKGIEYLGKANAIAALSDDPTPADEAAVPVLPVVVGGAELDRSRPFGEIFGDAGGARYAQDGAMFDVNCHMLQSDTE